MYLTPTNRHWALDIETDGLRDDCTQIFVVCVENCETNEKKTFTDKVLFNSWHAKDMVLVGHNSIAFDVPVLNRFWGAGIPISRCVDTFVLSQLYSPTLAGGHSLDSWGQRLKFPKLEHKDFTRLTDEMIKYCENDTALTVRLFNRLTQRMRDVGFTERGAALETVAWHLIQNKQRRHGFPFDYERAHKLYVELRTREEELKDEIYKQWPPRLQPVSTYKKAFKQNGDYSAQYTRHLEQYPKIEVAKDGTYTAFDWVEFNLASPTQRIAKLIEAGWKPVVFTKITEKGGGGNPKVDEDSILRFAETSGNKAAVALAKWVVVNSRANMINTWLNAYNEKTGAIHGQLWLASTLRYRHNDPNSANIPAVKTDKQDRIIYGEEGGWSYEARDLWTCGNRDKYSLVGIDAKGIQLRVLAHYVPDKKFREDVLVGDRHKVNMEFLGLPNKPSAKKFLYSLLLGAGGDKLAADQAQFFQFDITPKQASAMKKKLIQSIDGFEKLIRKLEQELERKGRIVLCDGTPLLVPSPHKAIAYLLQGDESRIMKQASVYLDELIRKYKFEAYKVGDIHDEWQFVVLTEQLGVFVEAALSCFPRAGKSFDYNVPIEGDAKIGKTWAETH